MSTRTTTVTKALQLVQLAATGGLTSVLINTDAPWWLWVIVFAWGLLTGAWGFSAGWDARWPR